MNNSNAQNTAAPNINITPLIDILLVLLIIFMMISPLQPARFEAKVPSEPEPDSTALPNPHSLTVTVDRNLQLKLNRRDEMGTVDDISKLSAELVEIFEHRRKNGVYRMNSENAGERKIETTVFIKAPRSISYGNMAKVIDGVKGTGAEPIALQIDDLEQ
jgi:biopolymer transport protein ExbD